MCRISWLCPHVDVRTPKNGQSRVDMTRAYDRIVKAPQSKDSLIVVSLPYIIFWIIAVVFLIVSVLLSYSLIRYQRKSTNDRETNKWGRDKTVLGIIWTLLPMAILVTLLVLAFQTMQVASSR
jgi:heme/copper-type cytochrome/quinol oxidase subunit 2